MRIYQIAGFAAFAISLVAAHSRLEAQSRTFGIKGGLTLASANIEDLDGTFDTDNRTGWGLGAFLTLGAGPLSIQPELNLIELGFKAPLPPPVGTQEVELGYLAPVILLKLGLPLPVVRPSLFGGVGIGIELNCRIGGVDCEDAPIQLETESTDPTGVFGADVFISIGSSVALVGDVRYAIGLDDIRKASDIWTDIRNRAWQVQAGLGFRF